MKLSKQARNDIRPHCCISSYTQAAIVGTSQLFNHSQRFFDHGKNFLTVNVEFFACFGEVSFTANLVKKLDAQIFFEVTYLRGDCRLAEVQLFSSAHIATVFGNDLKCGELMQIECTHKYQSPLRTDIALIYSTILAQTVNCFPIP